MNEKENFVEKYVKQMDKHTRKQKLREARRKAGTKRTAKKPRQKKITPQYLDEWDDLDVEIYEPILGKSERERQRKVENKVNIEQETNPAGVERQISVGNLVDIPENQCLGLVVEAGFGMCRVDVNAEILLCDIRGTVKDEVAGYVNVLAVGDQVLLSRNGSNRGVVESVLPRKSVLTRPFSPDKGKTSDLEQIVVANVDRLLIVASWREPYFWPALVDRYIIAAQRNSLESMICINKVDLVEDPGEFETIVKTYQAIGQKIILTSAVTGTGIPELRNLLTNSTTVLAGLSGVGKSTLLVEVQPNLDLKTGHVSEHGLFTGQGRHTTTQSSLWKLDNGGIVVDTPGVRTFGISGIPPSELADWYPEMSSHTQGCRFGNCSHINEPGCGVISAIESGEVSHLRYKNYTQIFDELTRNG